MDDYGISLGKLFFVGLLSVVLTVDAVVGLQAFYYWQLGRLEQSDDLYRPPADIAAMTAAQLKALTGYRMVDEEKGIAAVPIDRAMQMVVDELSRQNGPRPENAGDKP